MFIEKKLKEMKKGYKFLIFVGQNYIKYEKDIYNTQFAGSLLL